MVGVMYDSRTVGPATQDYTVATIPVIHAPASQQLSVFTAVESWYRQISHNHCRICIDVLPCVVIEHDPNKYAQAGGMGAPPGNSQTLVRHVLDCSDHTIVQRLRAGEDRLMIITGNAFKPHTWRLPNRGIRYSILPSNACFGAIAHELGHLLFDWPDLDWEQSLGQDCLMSLGALGSHGHSPSLPCAPLRLSQDWIKPIVIDRSTTVQQLNTDKVGIVNWQQYRVFVEYRRQHENAYLLIYRCKGKEKHIHPRVIGRMKLTEADNSSSVLGCIATVLRTC